MNLLEQAGKSLLAEAGIAVPRSALAGSPAAVGATVLLLGGRVAFAWTRQEGAPSAELFWALAAGGALAAPQLLPTLVALGEAGLPTARTAVSMPGDGLAGFLSHVVTHTPAPLFALAAVMILRGASMWSSRAAAVASAVLPWRYREANPPASAKTLLPAPRLPGRVRPSSPSYRFGQRPVPPAFERGHFVVPV